MYVISSNTISSHKFNECIFLYINVANSLEIPVRWHWCYIYTSPVEYSPCLERGRARRGA